MDATQEGGQPFFFFFWGFLFLCSPTASGSVRAPEADLILTQRESQLLGREEEEEEEAVSRADTAR